MENDEEFMLCKVYKVIFCLEDVTPTRMHGSTTITDHNRSDKFGNLF